MKRGWVGLCAALVFGGAMYVPEAYSACEGIVEEPLAAIQARFDVLDAQIRAIPPAERSHPKHRGLQEQGLVELEKLQCARERSAAADAAEERKRGLVTPFVEVPLLFITDREVAKEAGRFGPARSQAGVSRGRIVVTMQAERFKEGDFLPLGMKSVKVKDASAGISAGLPETLSEDGIVGLVAGYRSKLAPGTKTRLLVFVHGFNVQFADAAKAAARLAFGLRLDLLPVAISWPSQGAAWRYWQDEQMVESSVERFRPVFSWLLSLPEVEEVVIVGHSMGTRLVTRVLSQLELQKVKLDKLSRIIYAAADISEEELQELWPRIQPLGRDGWTFYTSSTDLALWASGWIHGPPRVGDSRDRVFSLNKAETINVAPPLKGSGHSYLIDSPRLQADLRQWIALGASARARGLKFGNRPPAIFWDMKE